jgi:hypothetical protein
MTATTIKGISVGGVIRQIDWEEAITNKPTIPTTVAELTDASNYTTTADTNTAVEAAISNLNLDDKYATKSYEEKVDTLESYSHTHANKTVLDGITAQNVTDWTAKQDALSDSDGGYGQRIKAVEDVLASAINFEAQKY